MLPIILSAVALVVVALLIVIALQPGEFRVERSATISATPATVFEQVNDLHKWEAWSPWDKIDPNLQRSYEGPRGGVGAKYHWVGNKKVGEGMMTVTQSRPGESVQVDLQFLKPFKANNTVEFTFKPQGNQTLVTWAMYGKKNFMTKAFHLFVNMDKMIGGDFEKGLASLKQRLETPARN